MLEEFGGMEGLFVIRRRGLLPFVLTIHDFHSLLSKVLNLSYTKIGKMVETYIP